MMFSNVKKFSTAVWSLNDALEGISKYAAADAEQNHPISSVQDPVQWSCYAHGMPQLTILTSHSRPQLWLQGPFPDDLFIVQSSRFAGRLDQASFIPHFPTTPLLQNDQPFGEAVLLPRELQIIFNCTSQLASMWLNPTQKEQQSGSILCIYTKNKTDCGHNPFAWWIRTSSQECKHNSGSKATEWQLYTGREGQ